MRAGFLDRKQQRCETVRRAFGDPHRSIHRLRYRCPSPKLHTGCDNLFLQQSSPKHGAGRPARRRWSPCTHGGSLVCEQACRSKSRALRDVMIRIHKVVLGVGGSGWQKPKGNKQQASLSLTTQCWPQQRLKTLRPSWILDSSGNLVLAGMQPGRTGLGHEPGIIQEEEPFARGRHALSTLIFSVPPAQTIPKQRAKLLHALCQCVYIDMYLHMFIHVCVCVCANA